MINSNKPETAGTMSARERMLGRLRAADAPVASDITGLDKRINSHFINKRNAKLAAAPLLTTPERQMAHMVQSMQANLTASHAEVWCSDAASWPEQLAARLGKEGVRRLLLDTAGTEGTALLQALPATVEGLAYTRPIEEWKTDLFETIDAGFTVVRSGIAATGTLILAPDAGTPRTVSLVPSLHVALVYAKSLHPDMHAAVQAERWGNGMPTNLIMVSGPSKTSDIQQTLAYGAHGPRWLWVIIVTEPAETPAAGAQS